MQKSALWLLVHILPYRWYISIFVLFDFGFTLWLVGFADFTILLVINFSFHCYIYNFSTILQ